jgi:microcystin-dependent protein
MALDFPANPVDQQVYGDYIYDAASTGWRSAVMVGAAPCGSIMPFAGATIPAGWLLCDGAAVSRTTYSSLFAALGGISSPWGLGDGSTTFNLPDLRKRVPVGQGASGTLSTLGAIGGAETMSLQEAHIAAHSHSFSATTSWQGDHQHAPPVAVSYGGSAGNYRNLLTTNTPLWSGGDWNCAVTPGGGHNHTISGTTGNSGSGSAFGLLQPYAIVNYIIKFAAVVAATDTELAVRMGQAEATVATAVSNVNVAVASIANKAPIASPGFTGNATFTGSISAGQPLIYGKISAGYAGNTLIPMTSIYNSGGFASITNGTTITIPEAGKYIIDFQQLVAPNGSAYYRMNVNGTNYIHAYTTGSMMDLHLHTARYFAANDYITLYYANNTPTSWSDEHSRFSVIKVA